MTLNGKQQRSLRLLFFFLLLKSVSAMSRGMSEVAFPVLVFHLQIAFDRVIMLI